MKNSIFQRIWLPGFLFQSVMIGGGYATGRELVEFFLSSGPVGGLLGMLAATAAFSLITMLSFELARLTRSYSYRSFFQQLLGRGWVVYELAYFTLSLLVLAVIGAAAGEIVAEHLGIRSVYGTVGLMLLIGVLVFYGTTLIEKVLAGWSFLLYATYAVFVVGYLSEYSADFLASFSAHNIEPGWLLGGFKYVGYSIAIIPVILFCVKHMESRRDAVIAGALAGPIAMIPAILFFFAMMASYPGILAAPVPADYMMQRLDLPLLKMVFYLVVFGTFVETGAALIHAINERIAEVFVENGKTMPRWLRPAVASSALILSIVLASKIGLVDLIAKGYGTLTWVFVLVALVPLLSVGVWKIVRAPQSKVSLPGSR